MASSGEPHWDAPGSHVALPGPPPRLASTGATNSHESDHPAGDREQTSRELFEAGARGEEWWCQVTETSLPGLFRAATPRSPSVVEPGSFRPRAEGVAGALRSSLQAGREFPLPFVAEAHAPSFQLQGLAPSFQLQGLQAGERWSWRIDTLSIRGVRRGFTQVLRVRDRGHRRSIPSGEHAWGL